MINRNKTMKKSIHIFIIILLISCNNQSFQNIFVKKKIKILEYKIIFDSQRKFETDSDIYNVFFQEDKLITISPQSVHIYDFDKDSIICNFSNPRTPNIESLFFLNKDSIFLYYNPLKDFGYHDSILILIDANGRIKHNYKFTNAPVLTRYNKIAEDTASIIYKMNNNKLCFIDNKIFLALARQEDYFGYEMWKDKPILGYVDTKQDTFICLDNIAYPDISYSKEYYPQILSFFSFIPINKNQILISFAYTTTSLIYDVKTKKIDTINLKSPIIDSIIPAKSPKDIPQDYTNFFFYQIFKTKDRYCRIIFMPFNKYGLGKYFIEIFDENFNLKGICTENNNVILYVTDTLFYYYNREKTESSKLLTIDKYSIFTVPTSNLNIIENIKKASTKTKNITEYFSKKIKNGKKKFIVTVIWYDMMCPNVSDFILKHYLLNENKYSQLNTYLLIIAEDTTKVKKIIFDNYNFNNQNIILFDNYSDYIQYSSYRYEPRVLEIKRHKIIQDSVFTVDEIVNLWQNYLVKLTTQN